MIVSHISRGEAEKIRVDVHRRENAGEKEEKLEILVGRIPRIHEIDPVVCHQRPVIVLPGAVHPLEGLFMEQALESVSARGLLQDLHDELIVVRGQVRLIVDAGQLMLRRRGLIVLCLRCHAKPPKLDVHIPHKGGHPAP